MKGMQRIPLQVGSDFKLEPVRANFPEPQTSPSFKIVGFEPIEEEQPTVEAPQPRNAFAVANDTVIEAANAAAGGVGAIANFISPGNRVSKFIDENIVKSGEQKQSDVTKASKAEFQAAMATAQSAEDEVNAVASYIAKNPLLSAAQAAGSFATPGFAIKGTQALGAAAKLGQRGMQRAGTVAGVTTGAAMAGGDAAGNAYELVQQTPTEVLRESPLWADLEQQGLSETQIRDGMATAAARDASILPALVGGVGGAFGAERLLAGIGREGSKKVLATGISEAAQEGLEEGVTQYEGRRAAAEFDPSIDPQKGVAGAAAMGAAMGGATGSGMAMLTPRAQGAEPIQAEEVGLGEQGGIEGEYVPAERPQLTGQEQAGNVYDMQRDALPEQKLLTGPEERQLTTARGLLKHSSSPSPEILKRLMRVDDMTALKLFQMWQGESNGADGQPAAEVATPGSESQGDDLLGGQANPMALGNVGPAGAGNDLVATDALPSSGEPEPVRDEAAGPSVGALDVMAHAAATSPFNATEVPTEAQMKAGNYKKGHIKLHGMDISIENPAGSVRSGVTTEGKPWQTEMQHHYGYIKGTVGKDKDHLDVFLTPEAEQADTAYVIDQIDPKTGKFDEHKIVIGALDEEDAKAIYHANYQSDWNGFAGIKAMPMPEFKLWAKSPDSIKPVAFGKQLQPLNRQSAERVASSYGDSAVVPHPTQAGMFAVVPASEAERYQSNVSQERPAVVPQASEPVQATADSAPIKKTEPVKRTSTARTLLGKVVELGGININVAQDFGADPSRINRYMHGIKRVFTADGYQDPSLLAEYLAGDFPQLNSENPAETLMSMVARAINGDDTLTETAMLEESNKEQERANRAELERQAKKLGIPSKFKSLNKLQEELLAMKEKRHAEAVEKLADRAKSRYAEALAALEALIEDPDLQMQLDRLANKSPTILDFYRAATGELKSRRERIMAYRSGSLDSPFDEDNDGQAETGSGSLEEDRGAAGSRAERSPAPAGREAGPESDSGAFELASQSNEEVAFAEQQRREEAERNEAEDRRVAEAERNAREAAEIQSRQAIGSENFQLGAQVNNAAEQRKIDAKRADEQLAGQAGLFNAPVSQPKTEDKPKAASTQASPSTGEIVTLTDKYGRTVRVRKSDLDGDNDRLPTVRADGSSVPGEEIPRSILSPASDATPTLNAQGRRTDGKPIMPGDTFRTLSGRMTTAYPKQKGEKFASQWLIDNAAAEAEARGDNFNASIFSSTKPLKSGELTTADRESMTAYLFDQQPDVVPSILKPLVSNVQEDATPITIAGKPVSEMSDKALEQIAQSKQPAAEKAKSELDRRNSFTIKRSNGKNEVEELSFQRGEYVEATISAGLNKSAFGEIAGISHAKRQAKVGEQWFDFMSINKAEKPAVPEIEKVPMSKAIDQANAKTGEGVTDADRILTLADVNDMIDRIHAGDMNAAQLKAAYSAFEKSGESIRAELAKMTKPDLFKAFPVVEYRYKNDNKDRVVKAAFDALMRSFVIGDSISWSMGEDFATVIRGYVDRTTDESLKAYADKRAAAVKQRAEEQAARKAGLEDPKTLEDFRAFMRMHMQDGKSRKEAFLMLTPEQRIKYDELEAESTRTAREARKTAQRTEVKVAAQTVDGQVIETKHTKTGEDLFVVKAAERVDRDIYNQWNATAKRLGGWYSSFRGNGAVPGFQFKTRENADAFLKYLGGDKAEAQQAVEARRDAFEDDRSQTAVERLNEMADRIEERADAEIGRERKSNTARRARFAASALAGAEGEKALAKTMRNIATAIESGNAKFLDAVRTKSQVEMLRGLIRTAKDNELRAKHPSYAEQEKRKGEPATAETADYAEFPTFTAFRSDLAHLARQMLEVDGTKKLGQQLMNVADDVTDAYLEFAKANIFDVSQFGKQDSNGEASTADFANKEMAEKAIRRSKLVGKAIVLSVKRGQNRVILSPSEAIERGIWKGDGDKRITLTKDAGFTLVEAIGRRGNKSNKLTVPWQFQNTADRLKALAKLGIETPAEFRSALRELTGLLEVAVRNKARELELSMAGRKNDGLDFFPTSEEVVDQMIEAAEISPDMAVLEPSAGMGHIADRIRAAGAEPDVIELSGERRELLLEKGYYLTEHNDFLNMEPRKFYTYGDVFRAEDGTEGIMRGMGGMGSQRVRLEDEAGNRLGLYNRDELTGVAHRGTWSGYDRIIMNPPFSNRRDAEHVRHAYELLKPGGRIVAIMGEGVFFGSDKKAQEFRDWLESVEGTSEKLPAGSFMDPSLPVNTAVNARMVVIDKPKGGLESRAGLNFAAEMLVELSSEAGIQSIPVSKNTSLKGIFEDLMPSAKFFGEHTREDERSESEADHRFVFTIKGQSEPKTFYVYTTDAGKVWIDVSRLQAGDDGQRIYAAVANWALNNRKKFVGDPVGLSEDAVIRRTSNMLASALRHGTTEHLEASREQEKGDLEKGIEPLDWRGNDFDKLKALIHTFVTTLYNRFPKLESYRYDFATNQFVDRSGRPVGPDRFADAPELGLARTAKAGGKTLRRGIFLKSLIDAEDRGIAGITQRVITRAHQIAEAAGPLFSKGKAEQQANSTSAIRAVVEKFQKQFKGTEALDIRVVEHVTDIPARYRPSPYAEGVFHDDVGLIYLIAGQLDSNRAFQVLMHEAVGHYGLAKMMGDRFAGILKHVNRVARADVSEDIYEPGDAEYATVDAVRLRYPEASEEEVAQEVLARMAETGKKNGAIWAMIRQWFRDMARALGYQLDISVSELNDLVHHAAAYMRKGENLTEEDFGTGFAAASLAPAVPQTETTAFKKGGGFADEFEVVAFSPEQIKSAIGNRGTFDPENPNILESRRGLESRAAPMKRAKPSSRGVLDSVLRKAGGELLAKKITGPAYDYLVKAGGNLISEKIKAGVVSDYGLEEPYLDRRIELQTAQQKSARQTKTLVDGLMDLDRAQSRIAYLWLNNKDTEADKLFAQLPPESRKVLGEVKDWIDKLSQEAVRLGQLSEEAFERNRYAYLHRSYAKYDLNTDDKGWKAERAKSIKILGDQYKGRGLQMDIDPDNIVSPKGWWQGEMKGKKVRMLQKDGRRVYVADGPIPPQFKGFDLGPVWEIRAQKGADRLVLWRDFTTEERQRMGELDEAKYAVARTLFMMNRDIEVGRFHEWVADNYAQLPEEYAGQLADPSESMVRAFAPDEFVQVPTAKVPGAGVFKYGALAGMVLPGPVWNDIRQISQARYEPLGNVYATILRGWKLSKTALTPTTHLNNVMGNFIMADMHDVGARDIASAVRTMHAALVKEDPAAKKLWERFEDSGATHGMFTTHELKKEVLEPLIDALRKEVGMADDEGALIKVSHVMAMVMRGQFSEAWAGAKTVTAQSAVGRIASKGLTKAQDYYQNEDAVFRFAAFLKGVNDGQTDAEAGKASRKAFLDYNINAPWVNAARSTAMPFIAFSYRAIPMLAHTAAHKPWKLAKYMLVAGGLNALAYAMLGLDDDDEKRERAYMPDEKAGKIWGIVPKLVRMPWNSDNTLNDGSKTSDPVFLDIRRWVPVGDVVDFGQDHSALPLIPQPMMPGGPIMLLAEFLANKSIFTGKEISAETDTWLEKASKVTDHFWKGFAPNVPGLPGTYATQKISDAYGGKEDPFGRTYDMSSALASGVGIKVAPYPTDNLQRNATFGMKAKLSELDNEARKLRREKARNGMTPVELKEKLDVIGKKKADVAKELAEKGN